MAAKPHTNERRLDELVVNFADALRDQNAAAFAGAGLSVPAGFVNWKELMRAIADDLGLSVDREHDLIAVAQYHQNERGGRHKLNQLLINEFVRGASLTENHQILARLPIGTFWTTNYDDLLEKALLEAAKTADVKVTVENLATNTPRRDAVVYKMHGDAKQPHEAVVTKDDYEAYNVNTSIGPYSGTVEISNGSSIIARPITTDTPATPGWQELNWLNAVAYSRSQSPILNHIPGGNIATAYFMPQLPPELEFDTATIRRS